MLFSVALSKMGHLRTTVAIFFFVSLNFTEIFTCSLQQFSITLRKHSVLGGKNPPNYTKWYRHYCEAKSYITQEMKAMGII